MTNTKDAYKIWSRFEAKQSDGTVIKLRIQGCALEPNDDVYEFLMKYFVCGEAVHSATGISRNEEAMKEYRELMSHFFKMVPIHATVCCVDTDTNNIGEILGVSIVQLSRQSDKLEDIIKDLDFKTEELHKLLYVGQVLESYTKNKTDYDIFYYGRGIIVLPEYRRLGIANEFVKVRKLICIDNDIPMTCAWMSAVGTQKAADKCNWNVLIELPLQEFEEKTGLTIENRLPSFKFMSTSLEE